MLRASRPTHQLSPEGDPHTHLLLPLRKGHLEICATRELLNVLPGTMNLFVNSSLAPFVVHPFLFSNELTFHRARFAHERRVEWLEGNMEPTRHPPHGHWSYKMLF